MKKQTIINIARSHIPRPLVDGDSTPQRLFRRIDCSRDLLMRVTTPAPSDPAWWTRLMEWASAEGADYVLVTGAGEDCEALTNFDDVKLAAGLREELIAALAVDQVRTLAKSPEKATEFFSQPQPGLRSMSDEELLLRFHEDNVSESGVSGAKELERALGALIANILPPSQAGRYTDRGWK